MNKILCSFIIVFFAFPLFADNLSELKEIKKLISIQERELAKLSSSKDKLSNEVNLLRSKKENIKKARALLKKEISLNNTKINSLKKDMEVLEKKQAKYNIQMKKQFVFLLDNSGSLAARAMLSGADSSSMVAVSELLSKVNSNMYEAIKEYNNLINDIKRAKAELNAENTRLLSNMAEYDKMSAEYMSAEAQLNSRLKLISKDEKAAKEYLISLENEYDRLNKAVKDRTNKNNSLGKGIFAKQKGRLIMPIKGTVIEKYGDKYIAEANTTIKHKGIKIKPISDDRVYSVADGVIVYVDYINGLDNVIIVQYDDEYFAVYANVDEFYVISGAKVKKNELLGRIDVDLKKESAYLYFEIRRNDTALDPLPWFKK